MNILISAYACEYGKGSEPEVGWQWVQQISRFNDICVITRLSNKNNIEYFSKYSNNNIIYEYIDLPIWTKFWKKGKRGVHLYYYLWQLLTLKKGLELIKYNKFNLSHHITFINDWVGPGISAIPISFLWGPIGSHPYVPKKFWEFIGKKEILNGLLRISARKSARYRDLLYILALKRAKIILTANSECKSRLPEKYKIKAQIFTQNAIDEKEIIKNKIFKKGPLKIISVGRLEGFKGFRLTLMAFAEHIKKHKNSLLSILGDGSQKKELEYLSKNLNINKSVKFYGNIPRDQVLNEMQNSNVFLFPSFEGAGMVVIEALAKGLPVVCLDFGGPGEYVTNDCGIKISLSEPKEVINDLAEGLNRLASDTILLESMSNGAIKRVKENYLWNNYGERINKIYKEIIYGNFSDR